jgi:predicted RNA methylase
MQDTGIDRKNVMEQFYTKFEIAKRYTDLIIKMYPDALNDLWIEPSAGTGSFLKSLPPNVKTIGIDLDPKFEGVIKNDFLEWNPLSNSVIVFGNPPFGRQSSTAKKFIRKSCSFAKIIAFILPRSFVKPSMQKCFSLNFHCVFCEEVEKNSFIINNKSYDVPCVFQIWEKKAFDRIQSLDVKPIGFTYVPFGSKYHLAFRRVGGRAGKIDEFGNKQTHYFLKLDDETKINSIREIINSHIFPSNTTGARSLSKSELNTFLNNV